MEKVSMWELFYTFLTIGTVTIGGGPGGIPIIQSYIVDKKKWVSQEEMVDYITMSQSMPGVISTNIGIFIGHKLRGKLGAVVAALAGVLPAFLSIIGIAIFLRPLLENPIVQNAFKGIRIGILGLIINAAYRMANVMKWNKIYIVLSLVSLGVFIFTQINPVILFIIGASIGLLNFKANTQKMGVNKNNGAN